MKTKKTVLVGLVAGITAVVLLGVLLASEKGKERRRKIIGKSGELAEELKDKFSDFVDGLKQKTDDLHQAVDDQIAKGKEKYEKVKNHDKNAAI